MTPLLAFTWTISLGSIIAIATVLIAAIGLLRAMRRERAARERQRAEDAPWKELYEASKARVDQEEAKVDELRAQTGLLTEQLAKEKLKTDVQPIAEMVGRNLGQVAAIATHTRNLAETMTRMIGVVTDVEESLSTHRDELAEHREDAARVSIAITGTLQEQSSLLQGLQTDMVQHRQHAEDRHRAIMDEFAALRRPPDARTRAEDSPT